MLWIGDFLPDLLTAAEVVEEHAIYLSTLKMDVQEQGVQMTIKVFEDDLRDALRAHHGYVIDTTSASFIDEVESYFVDHIKIDRSLKYAVDHVSLVGDSFVISASSSQILDDTIEIEADYFMELFPTQQNVLHFVHGEDTKYHIFKKGKGTLEISL